MLKPETGNEPRVFYIGLHHSLQNNLPGRPTLWAEDRKEAGRFPDEAEWRLSNTEEAENV